MKEMYLVLISVKGGYKMHSAHATADVAENWKSCKEFDGEDTSIIKIDQTGIEAIQELLEKGDK